MRHFRTVGAQHLRELFVEPPQEFGPDAPTDVLALGLGGTIYTPAIRTEIAEDIARCVAWGATSVALCLEDAVADDDVELAERRLVAGLQQVHRQSRDQSRDRPLLFVRVRRAAQIPDLVARLGSAAEVVTGFILPKFGPVTGAAFLDALVDAGTDVGLPFLAMPVLESTEIVPKENRADALHDLARLLTKFRPHVLALRLGATDLCGLFGIRRPPSMTIYDIKVVADLIGDVVNIFGRAEAGFRITGPVWEYYAGAGTPPTPAALDGLAREVALDQANGLIGKTVIHPSHLPIVHGQSVVTHVDHEDARALVHGGVRGGGAFPNADGTRMNESSPHRRWAHEVLARAAVFGVARAGVTVEDIVRAATP